MIRLPVSFETRYFFYVQMFRRGQKALWKRISKLEAYTQYELVIITWYPGSQNSRNLPKEKEYYPYYPELVVYKEKEAIQKFKEWA